MKTRSAALLAMAAALAAVTAACGGTTATGPATTTVTAAAQHSAAPAGSGRGLCFDPNSDLARSAIARLSPPPVGGWQAGQASDDQIASGCDGVLSWMMVNSDTNHPYTHVLFFTSGTYLGTATPDPYMYTMVTGKTRTSLSLTYHWLNGNDPMCCPQGGPSVVTFTLDGTKVTAVGQFPPHA
ncbi:LppP/LprE family lipoprotein [Nocardia aurantiaca]|uniref:LppP/LprE family lipoprotein n=1 Tax=Nocardia aurantiaca TaxID=2675850 RepID=A0A6I3L7S9_9NOCA|nr:LppP/LprE family lipoprotein [Nocardia aurantiaca]MTE17070.1 LppP/LprE family lipoprotein [Nocardia aurantiaca]